MNYHQLGRTQLSVSELALGTVELGLDYGIPVPGHFQRPLDEDSIRLVHAALEKGINFIDTARAYGESERVLGLALKDRPEEIVLATKVTVHLPDGRVPSGQTLRQQMLDSLETSLRLLQRDYVDLWQIHNVDEAVLAQREVLADLFGELLAQGKIRATGGSFYGAALPLAALKTDLFDCYQVTYSVLDQRLEDGFFVQAAQANVGVVARSVLLKGALTDRADHLPDRLDALRTRSRLFRQQVQDATSALAPAQAAIGFALAQPHIHAVLVGIRSQSELEENLQVLQQPLSAQFVESLRPLRIDDPMLLDPGQWGVG